MDTSRNYPLQFQNQFELYGFTDNPNFDQFIDPIRGKDESVFAGYDCGIISGSFVDDTQISFTPGDTFGLDASSTIVPDPNYAFDPLMQSLMEDSEEDNDEENSSGTTTTTTNTTSTTTTKKPRLDRSRTLISERRRRGRMKDKLYALRALVHNITKMDKASIIGDAVLYVHDLQMQAKKLKAEISGLEATLAGSGRYQVESIDTPVKIRVARNNNHPICKKIMQLNIFQVEETGFYVKFICNKGEGVAISLYKALESLTNFKVQNSNLVTLSDRFVLTSTLDIRDCEQSMNLPDLKLWVSGAFLNQGFEFITPLSS